MSFEPIPVMGKVSKGRRGGTTVPEWDGYPNRSHEVQSPAAPAEPGIMRAGRKEGRDPSITLYCSPGSLRMRCFRVTMISEERSNSTAGFSPEMTVYACTVSGTITTVSLSLHYRTPSSTVPSSRSSVASNAMGTTIASLFSAK